MKAITGVLISGVAILVLACGQSSSQLSQAHPHTAAAAISHTVPVKLEIPKLGIDATVEQVATDKNGQMGVPSDYRDVAWHAPGVIPGDKGDAVIAGHLDWVVNGKLTPAVFSPSSVWVRSSRRSRRRAPRPLGCGKHHGNPCDRVGSALAGAYSWLSVAGTNSVTPNAVNR